MLFGSANAPLRDFRLGLSGAVPEREEWTEPALDRAILEFVGQLSALVLRYGGRLVHGSHPSFTPLILRQARRHAPRHEGPALTLVVSALWPETVEHLRECRDDQVFELVETPHADAGGPEDGKTRNASLSRMRLQLINRMNALVVVGGKHHRADGKLPGTAEELELAIQRGMACFLVGALGGKAGELATGLGGFDRLRNGMSAEENAHLVESRDVAASVQRILGHLLRHPELASRELVNLHAEADGAAGRRGARLGARGKGRPGGPA